MKKSHFLSLFRCLLSVMLLVQATCAQAAQLDSSFDGDGQKFEHFGEQIFDLSSTITDMAIQGDGKIVLVGHATGAHATRFLIMRLHPDGALDSGFGSSGKVLVAYPNASMNANSVAIQGDGKVVVVGTFNIHSANSYREGLAVVRVNANGSMDNAFDGDGQFFLDAGPSFRFPQTLALQRDGKIVVTGSAYMNSDSDFSVARLNANGSPDSTFSGDGIAIVAQPFNQVPKAIVAQSDGKIVVAGHVYEGNTRYLAATRLNANGTADTSFSGDGYVRVALGTGGGEEGAHALALQSDGKIIVGGSVHSGTHDFAVARFNANGTLDSGFGNGGKTLMPIGASSDWITDIVVQGDNKIVAAGVAYFPFDSAPALSGERSIGPRATEPPPPPPSGPEERSVFAAIRLHTNGSLDASFDGDGKVILPSDRRYASPVAAALQGSGKIVIAGNTSGYTIGDSESRFTALRLQASGAVDSTFTFRGLTFTLAAPSDDGAHCIAVQGDGKILVAGSTVAGTRLSFAVARLNRDGSLDSTFANGGILVVAAANQISGARGIAVQGDGKIVLCGTALGPSGAGLVLVRVNANGSLDTSFSGDGKQTLILGSGYAYGADVRAQSDGKIVVCGSLAIYSSGRFSREELAVARVNADGSPDTLFDGDGKRLISLRGYADSASAIALQRDGKIVLCASSNTGSRTDAALVRLNANGSFDTLFDGDGKLILPLTSGHNFGRDALLQNDGKIVLAGEGYGAGYDEYSFVLARVNANGSLDRAFNGSGIAPIPVPESTCELAGIALQGDGKIVLGGQWSDYNEPGDQFVAMRVLANGELDTGFAPEGIFRFPVGQSSEGAFAIAAQRDNKILLAGSAFTGSSIDFAIARIDGGGTTVSVNNTRAFKEGSAASPGFTTFAITLNQPASQTITVNYNTTDGTAQAGNDYVAASGTLTFNPGEVTKYVRVNFMGDSVPELNETLFLNLRAPINATLANSRGSAYISNDDGPQIFIDNAVTVNEGNSGTTPQRFMVRLSAASTQTVTVNWATANGTAGPVDYNVASGTLTFAPGDVEKTITILVKGDTLVEPNETYKVNLSRPVYAILGDSLAVAYIRNDDSAPDGS